jgi:hypothetical protein
VYFRFTRVIVCISIDMRVVHVCNMFSIGMSNIDMDTQEQQMLQDIAEMEMLSITLSNPMMRMQAVRLMWKRKQILQEHLNASHAANHETTPKIDVEKLSSTRRTAIERSRQRILRGIRRRAKLDRPSKRRKCKMSSETKNK